MAFDDIAPIYDETRVVPDWVLDEFYKRALEGEIRSNPNPVVLDAGIGTGRTMWPLLNLGVELIGIDISKEMLEKASERLLARAAKSQVSLVMADVTHLPFRECSFDIAVAVHLLHLLKNWRQAIGETRRVLKPNSPFIVAGHNCPELDTKLGRTYLEILLDTVHKRGASKRIWRHMLKVAETKRIRLLKRILERVSSRDNWYSGLKRYAGTRETYTIRWKERLRVSTLAARLEKRFLSIRSAMSTEDYRRLVLELKRWRDEKTRKNPFLEMPREFTYHKVQFR